ncbi:MAG: zinc-ribbon domain-containing protein [Deltaproteobacteria bacterium]|jgi:predicted Zn finger-like uncharacterized protein|nr:zinc-ribbon domain-containing protein [Deltaproteobacteria bacterium]
MSERLFNAASNGLNIRGSDGSGDGAGDGSNNGSNNGPVNGRNNASAESAHERVKCPSCLSAFKVLKAKIPPQGVWTSCPNCSEKFFIPAANSLKDLLSGQGAGQDSLPKFRSGRARKGISYAESVDLREVGPETPTTTIVKKHFVGALVSAFVVLLLIGLAQFYVLSASTQADAETLDLRTVGEEPAENDPERIGEDLRFLKRQLSRYDRYHQRIDYRGVESRLFKSLRPMLSPNSCSEITSLNISADQPRYGFALQANCVGRELAGAKFVVRFEEGWAVVVDEKSQAETKFPIMPSAKRAAKDGAASSAE